MGMGTPLGNCQGLVERGLNANQMMITEFTNNHKLDAKIVLGDHL